MVYLTGIKGVKGPIFDFFILFQITKMELQQQQQQQLLLSVDGYFDAGGTTKALLTKLLSLVISLVAIVFYLISIASKIVMPFTTTR